AYTTLISIAYLQGKSGVGVSRIAEHLHLSGAFVTIEVSKLVETDLVKKRINRNDRRRVLLTVTPKGTRLLDDLVSVQAPVNDALLIV
ncbi:MarR family winged helix-turn-helix transcriptional regulator, partial [Enterobacter quasiroggenkampii]